MGDLQLLIWEEKWIVPLNKGVFTVAGTRGEIKDPLNNRLYPEAETRRGKKLKVPLSDEVFSVADTRREIEGSIK